MRKFLMLFAVLFVANAAQASDAPVCDFDHLAGKPYTAELFSDVGERPIRVLTPETGIEMGENVPGRINVLVEGEDNIIVAVACD